MQHVGTEIPAAGLSVLLASGALQGSRLRCGFVSSSRRGPTCMRRSTAPLHAVGGCPARREGFCWGRPGRACLVVLMPLPVCPRFVYPSLAGQSGHAHGLVS